LTQSRALPWRVVAISLIFGSTHTASAAILTGRIVSIADGDIVTLLDTNCRQHKIGLSGIDAPALFKFDVDRS